MKEISKKLQVNEQKIRKLQKKHTRKKWQQNPTKNTHKPIIYEITKNSMTLWQNYPQHLLKNRRKLPLKVRKSINAIKQRAVKWESWRASYLPARQRSRLWPAACVSSFPSPRPLHRPSFHGNRSDWRFICGGWSLQPGRRRGGRCHEHTPANMSILFIDFIFHCT